MRLNFTNKKLDQFNADLLALACCPEERPLRAWSGRMDWRLYGFLSRCIQQQLFTAKANEKLLLPGTPQLPYRWLLLNGLGSSLELSDLSIRHYAQQAIQTTLSLRLKSCLIAYPAILLTASYRSYALKWLLEGISAAATKNLNNADFEALQIYLPSIHEESIDLSSVMMSKLLSRHAVEQLKSLD